MIDIKIFCNSDEIILPNYSFELIKSGFKYNNNKLFQIHDKLIEGLIIKLKEYEFQCYCYYF
jgi:hypothetical protein